MLARSTTALLAICFAASGFGQGCERQFALDATTGSAFGATFVIDGDQAAVVATRDAEAAVAAGAVYLLGRDPSGQWSETLKFTAPDSIPHLGFGSALGLEGDRLAVAARFGDTGVLDSGSVYVYRRDLTGAWALQVEFSALDAEPGDRFGQSMSLLGDELLVGAYQEDEGATNAGAVYAFDYDSASGGWVQSQKLIASDPGDTSLFGSQIVRSGNHLLVAANRDSGVANQAGAVYAFQRDPLTGQWIETQKIIAPDPTEGARFGFSLSISSSIHGELSALVGAIGDKSAAGSVYFLQYDTSASLWLDKQKLSASDGAPNAWFGNAVHLTEDRAIVGSSFYDGHGMDSGAAYVFERDQPGSPLSEALRLCSSEPNALGLFGGRVLLDGDTAWVGASGDDELGAYTGALHRIEISSDHNGDGIPDACQGLGEVYCSPAAPNSTGLPATCRIFGSDLASDNNIVLVAADLPLEQFGYFLASPTQGLIQNPGGSQGDLCLGAPAARFVDQAQSSGSTGQMLIQPDLAQLPVPFGAVLPGESWRFTAWYRDTNPASTSNFTDAIRLDFL